MAAREPRYVISDLRPDRQRVDVYHDIGRKSMHELVAYSCPANSGDDWAVYERPIGGAYWSYTPVRSAKKMLDHLIDRYSKKKAS
jgi:hypothetical protein